MHPKSLISIVLFVLVMLGAQESYAQNRIIKVDGGRKIIATTADSVMLDSLKQISIDSTLLKKDLAKNKPSPAQQLNQAIAKKRHFSITKDTISPGAHFALSIVPGMGQLYNKQTWKTPTYIAAIGGFAAGGLITNSQYKSKRNQWQKALNLQLPNEITAPLNRDMNSLGTARTTLFALAGATYMFQLADATFNYRGHHNPVRKATMLAALFPGAGFFYTKTYWRLPIYYGGFVAIATVIDYNSRSYQRYKTAYNLVADGNPSTIDEFNGQFSADALKNARDGYRRNRDLGVICIVGAYALSIIDTYVIATLKNWDVSEDLAMTIEPTSFEELKIYSTTGPITTNVGMKLKLKF